MPFFQKSRKWIIPCAGVITLIASYFNVRVDINNGIFGNPLLYMLGAAAGTYLVITLCQCKLPLKCIWDFLGRNSLIVMGTHTLLIQILWHKFFTGEIQNWIASSWMLLIVLTCDGIIIFLVDKLKLIGKIRHR